MRFNPTNPGLLTYAIIFLTFAGCDNVPRNVPFPRQESEFTKPATLKLTFSEAKKLNWRYVNPDSTKPAERKIDYKNLPSKPIDIGKPQPLKCPVKDTIFSLDEILPDTGFNLSKMPVKPLKFKTTILGIPKRIKTGLPRLKDGASESILLFGLDQGLPGTVGNCFMQDKNGILWIGTDNGLCRFDGEYCEVYSMAQGLNFNWVRVMMEDSHGRIWINYMDHGLGILDLRKGIIRHITKAEGLSSDNILKVAEDKDGRIWAATNRGVNRIDLMTGTVGYLTYSTFSNNYYVADILTDKSGRIWVAVPGWGLGVIDPDKETVKHIGAQQGLGPVNISRITEDESGQIWVGTMGGDFTIINEKRKTIRRIAASVDFGNHIIDDIALDKDKKAWIGTEGGGVILYDPVSQTIKNFTTAEGLSNDNVFSVYADKQGQIWIGTNGGEVDIYNPNGGNLHHLNGSRGLSNGTSFIYGLTEDSLSRIWINSGNVIDIIDEKKGTLKSIDINSKLHSLFADSRGRVWAGGRNGVYVIDEQAGTINKFNAVNSLPFSYYGSFAEDSKGQVWVGRKGLFIINENAGTIKYVRSAQGYSDDEIECIMPDSKGRIWVGSINGVDVTDENAGIIKHITNRELNNVWVFNMVEDKTGKIWMATHGHGLFMIDQDAGTINSFSVSNGLEDMAVYTVNERNGSIYAGTEKGVNVIKPVYSSKNNSNETYLWEITSYGKPQGFLRVDHNPRSLLSKDGRLWWAIADVLTFMEEPVQDSIVPTPYITALQIMEQPQSFLDDQWIHTRMLNNDTIWSTDRDTFYTKATFPKEHGYLQKNKIRWDSVSGPYHMPVNLSLPFHQNHLTFYFTGNHLDNLNKTRYRYILEGNDKSWSDITEQSFADYRNLSPGRYSFKVNSRGFNGKWSTPAEIKFTVRPPWWLSLWAYIFYGLCLIALVYIAGRVQHRRVILKEREKIKERELAQAKEIEKAYIELGKTHEKLKSAQSQLIQSEKMASLGELTAGIAHEIQNPLNFIKNFSELNKDLIQELKNDTVTDKKEVISDLVNDIAKNEDKIIFHSKRADSIVKNMLQHSLGSTGQKQMTDINNLCDEFFRLAYHGLRAKDKSFTSNMITDFDTTLDKINVVSQDIGRVILNLVSNAFYAVTEKKKLHLPGYEPTVWVTTRKVDGKAEICVKDNGTGIPQKVVDKIFQPFFTTKPTGEGTGLGLSLAYDIITKGHGGDLRVETQEGEGSTFTVELPV